MNINKVYLEKIKADKTSIKTNSQEQKFALLTFLKEIGEKVGVSFTKVSSIDMGYPNVRNNFGSWDGSSSKVNSISFEEFFNGLFVPEKPLEVKLNSEYTALYEVGSDYVSVGCQKIPVDKLEELCKVIKDSKK